MLARSFVLVGVASAFATGAWGAEVDSSAGPAGPEPHPRILVTRQLAEALDLSVGDEVLLSSDPAGGGARPFRIAGTYEPTPDPMRLTSRRWEARLHLPDLVELTREPGRPGDDDTVTAIRVALRDPSESAAFGRDLAARVPGLVALPNHGRGQGAAVFVALERFHLAIALVTVLGSTAFLLALMVMRAEERGETIGILRTIGLSRRRILLEVLLEGLLIGLAGAVFGVLFAAATQGFVNRFFQWRYDTALVFVRITPQVAWRSVVLAVPLGILASIVASWTLLRRDVLSLARR